MKKTSTGAGFRGSGGSNGTETGQRAADVPPINYRMARNSALDILGYTPPELHEGSTWYIDYYVKHPLTGGPHRVRMKVNRPKGLTARRQHARALVMELGRKLAAGWRPWVQDDAPNAHRTLHQGVEAYLDAKVQDLRHTSPGTYRSMAGMFMAWAERQALNTRCVHAITRHHAMAYMEHVRVERKASPRTWNNHRLFAAIMWNWFLQHGYTSSNPFQAIRERRVPRKARTFLSSSQRAELDQHLQQHCPGFRMVCLLVYHTLIRPRELTRMRVGMVDLGRQVMTLPASITKNGEDGVVAIPDTMMKALTIYLRGSHPDQCLVGKGWAPSYVAAHRNAYSRQWNILRRALGWGPELQLYSLRDTGIIDMLRAGVDVLAVRQQARHKSLATTNAYLQHALPEAAESVKRRAPSISQVKME